LKKENVRVKLFHEGALIESNKSFFYSKKNAFKAEGEVVFTQGDSLRMTSDYMEYDGETGKAKAWGDVFLKQPDMTLETDTLFLDRFDDLAYYETPGTIVDSASILKSNRGKYYMKEKKYRFISNVRINNPEYKVTSSQLDYYTESNKAYLYGPTKIIGEDYDIYCEQGFYDTNTQEGYFKKNAEILYNNKIINGDSLYFENERNYAAATNKVEITDTINQSIIRGNYAEIFKAKDSAIITRKALAINIIENDSLYIHADTLVGTGPSEARVLRGYYGVKILKEDLRGKSDSLYLDETIGRKNGYNQIVGKELYGDFLEGALNVLDVIKNTQVLYYLYSDAGELVGIDKTICSALNIQFKENEIEDISFYVNPEGDVFPDKELDPNLRKLEGFLWREEERPKTLEDLFKKD